MTENTLQSRLDLLPPLMKQQFNVQLEKECKESEFVSKDSLDRLATSTENASVIMNRLLTSDESANFIHRYLKHFDRPANMKKTTEILIDALKEGDEMLFKFCYLARQKGIQLTSKNFCCQYIQHPGLITDDTEFKKWLLIMGSPELKNFDSRNPQHIAPYLEWVKTPCGQNFQARRENYTQALQWYKVDYCPIPCTPSKKTFQIQPHQRDS